MGACNQHEDAFQRHSFMFVHILLHVNLQPISTNLYANSIEMH